MFKPLTLLSLAALSLSANAFTRMATAQETTPPTTTPLSGSPLISAVARPITAFNTRTPVGRKQLFMQLVRESYEKEILGTQTAPVKVLVTFHSFDVAAPIVNKVTTVGARVQIINFGAEPNAALYPIKARLTVTRTYGGQGLVTTEELYFTYQGYLSAKGYLSKGGEWRVSGTGPVR